MLSVFVFYIYIYWCRNMIDYDQKRIRVLRKSKRNTREDMFNTLLILILCWSLGREEDVLKKGLCFSFSQQTITVFSLPREWSHTTGMDKQLCQAKHTSILGINRDPLSHKDPRFCLPSTWSVASLRFHFHWPQIFKKADVITWE